MRKRVQVSQHNKIQEELDEEFVSLLTFIEQQYSKFNKHVQIRIEKWVQQLLQCDQTLQWKKSRNYYLKILAEMMEVQWVGIMFNKMPPEHQIPNISNNQFKRIISLVRSHKKPIKSNEQKNYHFVSMKKVTQAEGDFGSQLISPQSQTERQIIQDCQEKEHKENKTNQVLRRVYLLLMKHSDTLNIDKQYENIVEEIKGICDQDKESDRSVQLKIEEGIEQNRINLLQFGSPRGYTQMQYFKAALQL